jgi:Single-stranded DNA-binding protein, Bacteriophage T7
MTEKFKAEKLTTAAGIAQYPYIDKPDGKFPKENPKDVYKVDLILDDDEKTRGQITLMEEIRDTKHKETLKSLKLKLKEATPAGKKKVQKKLDALEVNEVYETHYDDAGEETGKVILKFKMNAEVKNRKGEIFTQKPNVFDCSKPCVSLEGVAIWKGSTLKVAGEIIPYFMESTNQVGISLRLKAVQVIQLVSAGQADAASYGFGEEEGGFHQEAPAGKADFDEDDDEDSEAGEDDDF